MIPGLRASPAAPQEGLPRRFFRAGAEKTAQSRPQEPDFRRLGPKTAPADPGRTRRAGGDPGAPANCFGVKKPRARRVSDTALFSALRRLHRLVSRGESMPKLPRCRAGQPTPLMPHGRRSEYRMTRVPRPPSPATRTHGGSRTGGASAYIRRAPEHSATRALSPSSFLPLLSLAVSSSHGRALPRRRRGGERRRLPPSPRERGSPSFRG